MKIIAVILAKSDSKRLPSKNTLDFCGKPMFIWNTEKCLPIFPDGTYVSSDSDQTLQMAIDAGARTHKRTWRLCGDKPNMKVYQDIIKKVDCEGIVAVQANSPTVSIRNILIGKKLLEWGTSEAITQDRYGKIYGSVWALTRKTIEECTPGDMWERHPDVTYFCDSIDIHTPEDFKKAEAQWKKLKSLPR